MCLVNISVINLKGYPNGDTEFLNTEVNLTSEYK